VCAVLAVCEMVKYAISLSCSACEATYQTAFTAEQMACWLRTHGEKMYWGLHLSIISGKCSFILLFAFSMVCEGTSEQEMSVPRFLNARRPFRCSFLTVCLNLYLYEGAEILVPTLFFSCRNLKLIKTDYYPSVSLISRVSECQKSIKIFALHHCPL